jgi:hypothetical protein
VVEVHHRCGQQIFQFNSVVPFHWDKAGGARGYIGDATTSGCTFFNIRSPGDRGADQSTITTLDHGVRCTVDCVVGNRIIVPASTFLRGHIPD